MRLIDADALMGEVESVLLMYSQFNHWLTKDIYTRMKIAVRAMPTIDAVPVVRCKECKHWNQDEVFKTSSCRISYDEKGFEKQTDADFFCGYGKRKDGE